MKSLDVYWYSQNPVAWLLLPISWFYCALVILRRWLYRIGIIKSYRISVPLVIVGNISVGGTGKTPLLIALCDLLKKQGIKPGIVSRGYGGSFTGERLVDDTDAAEDVGDEPFLIAKRTQCPVAVGKNRVAAAELLLKKHTCDIVLSDDGLQHYRMRRDLEIAVVDVKRQFGNEFCLPAGPLRESVGRLKSVDMIIYHGETSSDNCFMLEFSEAINLLTREARPVTSFRDAPVHAVAGIGHPERFFDQLENADLTVIRHPFPDHYGFNESDLKFDEENEKSTLLMTEKDAVKCDKFATENNWYIPVTAKLSEQLVSNFLEKIKQSINA
jgi:tetraacyldisaccharide 4'-kinase